MRGEVAESRAAGRAEERAKGRVHVVGHGPNGRNGSEACTHRFLTARSRSAQARSGSVAISKGGSPAIPSVPNLVDLGNTMAGLATTRAEVVILPPWAAVSAWFGPAPSSGAGALAAPLFRPDPLAPAGSRVEPAGESGEVEAALPGRSALAADARAPPAARATDDMAEANLELEAVGDGRAPDGARTAAGARSSSSA